MRSADDRPEEYQANRTIPFIVLLICNLPIIGGVARGENKYCELRLGWIEEEKLMTAKGKIIFIGH